jgi:hypothetical protein
MVQRKRKKRYGKERARKRENPPCACNNNKNQQTSIYSCAAVAASVGAGLNEKADEVDVLKASA